MKRLLLILPIVFLAACASKPPQKITLVPTVMPSRPVDDTASVRRPEEVRQYRFGRYIDPTSRVGLVPAQPVNNTASVIAAMSDGIFMPAFYGLYRRALLHRRGNFQPDSSILYASDFSDQIYRSCPGAES